MIQPQPTFHNFTTDQLVDLVVPLNAYLAGSFTKDSADYEELVDVSILAAVQTEIGHDEPSPLLDELAFALQARHPQIAASLAAWHAWNHRSITWGEALLRGADAVAEDAAALIEA